MELTVLGYWSPYPRAGEACSGYLVRSEDTRVLVDCGHAVFSILQKYQDFRELDAVIISHFHPDHYVDLYALRHAIRGAMFQERRKHPLRLLIPAEPAPLFDYWSDTQEFNTEAIAGEVIVGDLQISFAPTIHSMPGYSVVVEDSRGRRLVYTGDTDYVEERLYLAEGAELLVAEASIKDQDRQYARKAQHLTAREAGRWAAVCGVQKLLVTHLWPEYEIEAMAEEARQEYSGEMYLAQEGLTITV